MVKDDDARMVAERLGLHPEDADEVRAALDDVATLGQDGFEDQTLREVAGAVQAAYAGQRPTEAQVRRAQVRKAIALALLEFTEQRAFLTNYKGPAQ